MAILIIGALRWAQAIVIPIALATLLAFLLSPVLGALHRWGLGRIPAALLVLLLGLSAVGTGAWALSVQLGSLLEELPLHKETLKKKIAEVRPREQTTALDRARAALNEVVAELDRAIAPAERRQKAPTPVVVREDDASLVRRLPRLLRNLASAGLVIVLVIFMLVERQALRDRVVRLVGYGRLTLTTKALDEAGQRISRYLLTQALVNAALGLGFFLGLLGLGVPYALLWGVVLALARYVPFVGVWPAALLPAVLSLALSESWLQPLLVMALFVTLELLINVVVEPIVYSQRTGLSKVALLVSVAFWAWLWGPVGLLLATPLTVCLVVLAKYVPEMDFLVILLSQQPAMEPGLSYYQRLVARDSDEAAEIVEARLRADPPEVVFDRIVLPALVLARRDRVRGRLTAADERFVVTATREIVEDVATREPPGPAGEAQTPPASAVKILGWPARDEAEAVALLMFRQLLNPALAAVEVLGPGLLSAEVIQRVVQERPPLLCVASLPPGGQAQARYLLKRLRGGCPDAKILVGRWGATEDTHAQRAFLLAAGADYVATTLTEARDQLLALAPLLGAAAVSPGERPPGDRALPKVS